MRKTKVLQPVDIEDHQALRDRVATLEGAVRASLSILADTHPEGELLSALSEALAPAALSRTIRGE